jgi:putative hemolysin
LRLRYEVFCREYRNVSFPLGMEVDAFDAVADHLIILDRASSEVLGTYRLLSSCSSPFFYSETEFALGRFLATPGIKLELSRACIRRDSRDGMVIHLLWRGLARYAEAVSARFLFGCGSVKTTKVEDAVHVYRHLQRRSVLTEAHQIEPLPAYRMPKFPEMQKSLPEGDEDTGAALVPALLNAYLRAGAKVYGQPALDRAFGCIDFLTALEWDDLARPFGRKYSEE